MKQINTGNAKILIVKTGNKNPTIDREGILTFSNTADGIILPSGKWTILGFADELTEEVCEGLMDCIGEDPMNALALTYSYGKNAFFTAKDAWQSLLTANQVYSVNPYEKPAEDNYSFFTHVDMSFKEAWQQAEANTGKHIVLKLEE